MKNFVIFLFVILVSTFLRAQENTRNTYTDTIRPGYSVSGSFDSLTLNSSFAFHLSPFQNSVLQTNINELFVNHREIVASSERFSRIPHVGLIYSFGSQAGQFAKFSYTQQLSTKWNAQFDLRRRAFNGITRNSNFEENKVDAVLKFSDSLVENHFSFFYLSTSQNQNEGLVGDSIDSELPLNFQQVNTEDAKTKKVRFWALNQTDIFFSKSKILGIYLSENLRINNQRFEEEGIQQKYSFYNFDSVKTNDYWEERRIVTSTGLLLKYDKYNFQLGPSFHYWDFDNFDNDYDSTELWIKGHANYQNKTIFAQMDFQQNVSGAGNGQRICLLGKSKLPFGELFWNVNYDNRLVEIYQRELIANNYNYSWVDATKTKKINSDLSYRFSIKNNDLALSANILNVQNQAWWLQNTWRQDTLTNQTFVSLYARANFRFSNFFIQPKISYQLVQYDYLPNIHGQLRFGINKLVLKSKKMRLGLGAELEYASRFAPMAYSILQSEFLPFGTGESSAYFRVNSFIQFDLGFFRWFVKAENLNLLFQTPNTFEVRGFPTSPFQFRFGLSWDLFN